MPRQLLLATSNQHKLREMRALLGDIPFTLVSPRDLGLELEVDEPFDTYRENALQKSRAYAEASGLIALADDSGLEIDAMNGEPGVFSARFGAPNMPYPERFALIEQRLVGVSQSERMARFRCVMTLVDPALPPERTIAVMGSIEGVIVPQAQGINGFGYDPIFFLPERGLTMAELPATEKDAISHRGQAARAMADILRSWP